MRSFLTTVLCLGFATSAQAQCLSFETMLELSADRDPAVAILDAQAEEALSAITQAKSLSKPRISAIARSGFGETGIAGAGVSNSFGLRASQRLFDFGDAKRARRAATTEFDAAQHDQEQAQLTAATEAGLALIASREARAQLDVTRERVTYFETLLAATDTLLQAGGATLTERATVASQLADAQALTLELEFQLAQADTLLSIATGSSLAVCESYESVLAGRVSSLSNPESALSRARETNPTLAGLRDRAETFDVQAQRSERARLPVVEVVATGAYSSFDGVDNFGFRERIGVDISVPLYSGGSLSADRRGARARASAARARILDTERTLREQIMIGWRRMESLSDQMTQRAEVERQSAVLLEAAETQREAGTLTLRELVDIRLEFESAQLQSVSTRHALARERLSLLNLSGTLLSAAL